jgi:DNA modification methylase
VLTVQYIALERLKANDRKVRTHPKNQIQQIASSILAFGFTNPILIDEQDVIIAGHGRYEAAKLLALKRVPVIGVHGLSETKRRALALADNKIAANAGWDRERLAAELLELTDLLVVEGLEVSITGFAPVEIDQLVADFVEDGSDPDDTLDPAWSKALLVSQPGDLWRLGDHRLLCADARDPSQLARLMGDARAAMGFLDPPYNVKVRDIVGRGRIKHSEFAMASGELRRTDFVAFLHMALANAATVSRNGAVHFVCMDWRHIGELFEAGASAYGETLNLVVWTKTNAGQGSFYRSQHELIGVFRVGDQPHVNNIELGRHGRSRSNVWHYAGVNTFRAGRLDDLKSHPTVKPVALVADAIKDVSCRRDVVLDTFCGSGTTIVAAERVGRRAYALELEPRFVDVAVRRWQAFTRRDAVHENLGLTFDDLASSKADRSSCSPESRTET